MPGIGRTFFVEHIKLSCKSESYSVKVDIFHRQAKLPRKVLWKITGNQNQLQNSRQKFHCKLIFHSTIVRFTQHRW